MRVPFFSRARGARIAPVGRELLASGVRVRACARSLSVFVEIQWMQSDFSGAGANGHPAFATPRHTAMRMACSAISVGDCVCGERRGAITIDLLKMPQPQGKAGLRSTSPVLPLISPFFLFFIIRDTSLRQLLPTASTDSEAAAGPAAPRSPRGSASQPCIRYSKPSRASASPLMKPSPRAP